ncbi:MAG TPA: methyltransferase domain-containing protein [Ktedonobacterales bacterium]|nr:methyltransferase domain-containing protein [Ktedonobacterales bacterium]
MSLLRPAPPPPPAPVILSHYQAAPLLAAHAAGAATATTSADLGLSSVEVALADDGIRFPSGEMVGWEALERIRKAENQCFAVESGEDGAVVVESGEDGAVVRPIRVFSETTNWLRSLMPTAGAPTMLVAGFPMHRIKGTEPWADTLKKIAAAGPITGHVLDTATGLGYTAIAAARTAEAVTTIELDPAGLEVTRQNPWSHELFDNLKITQIVGDAFEETAKLPGGAFSVVLHDPPTLSLAGELYSEAFYRELHRVLAPRGRLFHYIGDLESGLGKRVASGATRRLRAAGFRRVTPRPEAFGLLATK